MNTVNPDLVGELERALETAALIVERDAAALPIFERIDRELTAVRAELRLREINDPVTRARELSRLRKEAGQP